ncbi:MAG: DUF6893 family small protein [Frankia sp.]
MKFVGITATGVVGLGVLAGIAVGIVSIPDIRRYFRIRSM